MTEKIKQAGKTANKTLHDISVLVGLAAGLAAALKVATEPMVQTGFGRQLPVWQLVAAVLGTVILGYVYTLQSKKG